QEIVARHPRLARDAGGDDDDVGAGAVGPVRRAADLRVVPQDGSVLLQVQRLSFRDAFLLGDVEQHDVTKLVAGAQRGQLAADVAGANQGNLVPPWHTKLLAPG